MTTTLVPYLAVAGGRRAIAFYKAAFGAELTGQLYEDGERIGHADLKVGEATFSLSDEHPEIGVLAPTSLGGAGVHMILSVEDPDEVFASALAAGAVEERPMRDEPHGRMGVVNDPFGHRWFIHSL